MFWGRFDQLIWGRFGHTHGDVLTGLDWTPVSVRVRNKVSVSFSFTILCFEINI